MPPPSPTNIFHITAIPNLSAICSENALLCKNSLGDIEHADIAYQTVQGHRAQKPVTAGSGGVIHDYVPFYFAPRSPMLFTINRGNVPGCDYRQDDIVHLRTTVQRVVDDELDFVFYNYNAATAMAECFDNLEDLTQIDWELFFESPLCDGYCKYWNNTHRNPRYARRMETRQAEFLVHDRVPLSSVEEVVVRTPAIATQVEQIVRTGGWSVPVRAQSLWYF